MRKAFFDNNKTCDYEQQPLDDEGSLFDNFEEVYFYG